MRDFETLDDRLERPGHDHPDLRIAPDTRKLEAIDIPPIVCAGL